MKSFELLWRLKQLVNVLNNAIKLVCIAYILPVALTGIFTIQEARGNLFTQPKQHIQLIDERDTAQVTDSNIKSKSPVLTRINEERKTQKLIIYPNPTTGTITMELPAEIVNFKTKVYSSDGSLRHSSSNQHILNLEQLNPGTYIIQVISGNKNFIERIVKL